MTAPKSILFVEDNLDDFIAASIALSKIRMRNKIVRVCSADEMLAYFRGVDQYLDRDRYALPAAVIMDMRMPNKDGLEAQAMLRANLRFRHVPIIAISSCESIEQLKTAVTLGADAWMLKPFSAVEFINIARNLNLDIEFENPVVTPPPMQAVA
jgi:CheY-like chemotaxis protein